VLFEQSVEVLIKATFAFFVHKTVSVHSVRLINQCFNECLGLRDFIPKNLEDKASDLARSK